MAASAGSAPLYYMSGFGASHATESLPGALPVGRNSPQRCPYGLYAEQLSCTAFTAPRAVNKRSWLYRIRPSVMHSAFVACPNDAVLSSFGAGSASALNPNQLRWSPPPFPTDDSVDWLSGLFTMAGAGSAESKNGVGIHMYAANASMVDTAFYSADGEMLLVPQAGTLHLQTEMGLLDVAPGEIAVIPRGVRFRVGLDGPSRGYVLEVYNSAFALPELGPLGANGLAAARDFLYPVAAWEDRECAFVVVSKFGGDFFSTVQEHSPFDVVAWHGTASPYKYDTAKFNTIGTVSFDHPDPSIFTCLTAPTDTPGVAAADFVLFPPRWMVGENTFRPPYFHRNCASEFMGVIWGNYDAKVGFVPGGASLHSPGTPHGPDAETFVRASNAELRADKFMTGCAFMFETHLLLRLTTAAMAAPWRDVGYQKCWARLPKLFDASRREPAATLIAAAPAKTE